MRVMRIVTLMSSSWMQLFGFERRNDFIAVVFYFDMPCVCVWTTSIMDGSGCVLHINDTLLLASILV
jgi:hypothetical protein